MADAITMTTIGSLIWGLPFAYITFFFMITPKSIKNPIGVHFAVWLIEQYISNLGFIAHLTIAIYMNINIWTVTG